MPQLRHDHQFCSFRGNFVASFYVQPMGFVLAVLTSGAAFWVSLYMGITGKPVLLLLRIIPPGYYLLPLMFFAIAAWGWKIFIHWPGLMGGGERGKGSDARVKIMQRHADTKARRHEGIERSATVFPSCLGASVCLRAFLLLLPCSFAPLLTGCVIAGAIAHAIPETNHAAYTGLAGQTVGVMVWADRGVLINFNSVQLDLGNDIQNKLLHSGQAPEMKGTSFPWQPASIVRYPEGASRHRSGSDHRHRAQALRQPAGLCRTIINLHAAMPLCRCTAARRNGRIAEGD